MRKDYLLIAVELAECINSVHKELRISTVNPVDILVRHYMARCGGYLYQLVKSVKCETKKHIIARYIQKEADRRANARESILPEKIRLAIFALEGIETDFLLVRINILRKGVLK
jgi:hypothetical protein